MAFGVPYQQPGFAPGYYPMGQQMPAAMPDQLAQWRQGYQPAQQQQQATQQAAPIIWAQGEEAAKASFCAPGQSTLIMDIEKPVFYMKTVDISGMPQPLRIFDYTERTAAQKQPVQAEQTVGNDFVTRAEFDALSARFDAQSARFDALTVDKPLAKKMEDDNAKSTV